MKLDQTKIRSFTWDQRPCSRPVCPEGRLIPADWQPALSPVTRPRNHTASRDCQQCACRETPGSDLGDKRISFLQIVILFSYSCSVDSVNFHHDECDQDDHSVVVFSNSLIVIFTYILSVCVLLLFFFFVCLLLVFASLSVCLLLFFYLFDYLFVCLFACLLASLLFSDCYVSLVG